MDSINQSDESDGYVSSSSEFDNNPLVKNFDLISNSKFKLQTKILDVY